MTYEETLEYLFTRLPMYQRVGETAYKKDLGNTIQLLDFLDNPHKEFKSIHIAGTNGKGTSAHGIAAIMQTAGYKTGLYTSPHLKSFTERIRIDGKEISKDFVVDFVNQIKEIIHQIQPSFFEITVAMSFAYFSSQKVDIAVIETGLGGRLDSTNVITPEVSLITHIGYDHMDILGDTLEKIATEKAGIIKHGVPVVIGETHPETAPVFEQIAKTNEAILIKAGSSGWKPTSLVPDYFLKNMGGIEAVIHELVRQGWTISEENIREGISNIRERTGLKGRLQILNDKPLIIADVSHNEEGLEILFDQVVPLCKGHIHLVFGSVKGKDLRVVFNLIPQGTKCYWTQSMVPRALPVEELAIQGMMNKVKGDCFENVNEAVRAAKEKMQPDDLILITGSTFIVAEMENL